MKPTRWLVDKSALWRVDDDAVADRLEPLIQSGLVHVSIATELEVGFSARSTADSELMRERVMDRLIPATLPFRAEGRARDVQRALLAHGHHRAVSVPDLLISATAEMDGLTVLHYDADFDLIAGVTGQAMEWVVPRGTVD